LTQWIQYLCGCIVERLFTQLAMSFDTWHAFCKFTWLDSIPCRPRTVWITVETLIQARLLNVHLLLKSQYANMCQHLTTNYMFRFLLMSELWHCLILLGVLEVFWFYATLIIFVDNNNNNNNNNNNLSESQLLAVRYIGIFVPTQTILLECIVSTS